jgi:hypothetical protein
VQLYCNYRKSGALAASAAGTVSKSLPRKTSKHICVTTVPQTDTGVQLE